MSRKPFGAWLAGELRRHEWNASDFARYAHVTPSMVSRWLRGTVPSPESCDVIADVLRVDVDEVLTLAGHRPALLDDDPELAGLISLLRRVERTPERVTFLRSMLESMLEGQAASGAPRRRSRPAQPPREAIGA